MRRPCWHPPKRSERPGDGIRPAWPRTAVSARASVAAPDTSWHHVQMAALLTLILVAKQFRHRPLVAVLAAGLLPGVGQDTDCARQTEDAAGQRRRETELAIDDRGGAVD